MCIVKEYKDIKIVDDFSIEAKHLISIKFRATTGSRMVSVKVLLKDFKEYFLKFHRHNGINAENIEDFINRTDVKYKIDEEYLQKFIFYYLYSLQKTYEEAPAIKDETTDDETTKNTSETKKASEIAQAK